MDLSDRKAAAAGEDRISNLPDQIIHHILSFLETKHVAQTSVLSKRWSHIWTSVPILAFRQVFNYDLDTCSLQTNKFMNSVDGTLLRRDKMSDIKKFSLVQFNTLDEYRVKSWITNVTSRNVEELDLALGQEDPFVIPVALSTCDSLVSLDLNSSMCFPKYVFFPKLKRLSLTGVQFSNECWNEKLFSKCPVLEDLVLEHCTYGTRNFYVSSTTLKLFHIANWDDEDGLQDCGLEIYAPNLVSIIYCGRVAKEFVLPTSPKLVEADVSLYGKHLATREKMITYGTTICQFLRVVAHVKRLVVSDTTFQALSVADDLLENLPTFYKSTQLSMTEDEDIADKALIALLKATPNLESLVFDKISPWFDDESDEEEGEVAVGKPNPGNKDYDWILDAVIPECLLAHLKSVCFKEFTASPREIKWVQLILKNAKALQTMSISTFHCSDLLTRNRRDLMAEITSLPRASTSCMFKLPSWRS